MSNQPQAVLQECAACGDSVDELHDGGICLKCEESAFREESRRRAEIASEEAAEAILEDRAYWGSR